MSVVIKRQPMTLAAFKALPETTQPTEFINSELIVSATPKDTHNRVKVALVTLLHEWLQTGRLRTAPSDVYFGEQVLQPDVFWIRPDSTDCTLGEDDYWHGAPDLIVEVLSPGTASRDRGVKYNIYEQTGVREYWIVDPLNYTLEVYTLTDDATFERVGAYGSNDTVSSPLLQKSVVVGNIFS